MTFARRRNFALASAGAMAVLLAACQGDSTGRPPEPGDRAVATIDGKAVWASDVRREAVAQGLIGEGEPLPISSELFGRTLHQVIDQKLLAREASKRRLDQAALAQRRITAARERVMSDLVIEDAVKRSIDEKAVQRLYQEQVRLTPRTDEIRARQIIVPTGADAQQIRRLLSGGASFEALAMQRSSDAETRFNGGDLGWIKPKSMPQGYAAALTEAQPGALVGPFPVSGGFALVKVENRRPASPPTFQQARPQIVRFLTYDEIRDQLERLRAGSKVKLLIATRRAVAPVRPPVAGEAAPPPGYVPPGGLRPMGGPTGQGSASPAEPAR